MRKHKSHPHNLISTPKLFLHCGIIGICMEVLYTSLRSLQSRDYKLHAHTSLWMFPIYGSAAFLRPLFFRIHHWNGLAKGTLYACLLFAGEFTSGVLLSLKRCCPWDYSRSRKRMGSHIRLDFFPLWFLAGLFYEDFALRNGFLDTPRRRSRFKH